MNKPPPPKPPRPPEPIETIVIQPTKEMPLEVFRELYRIAFYMELMERLPDGRVLWDERTTSIYDAGMADVAFEALRDDWYSATMELPKKLVDRMSGE